MMEAQPIVIKSKSFEDAAIDGLFGGLIAGVLMILVLILAGLVTGDAPASVLARFHTGQAANPWSGSLIHLAVSGIYGVIFSLLVFLTPGKLIARLPGWLVGLVYGLLLLALALNVLLPGLRSALQEMPWGVLAVGHLVYGLTLGWRVYPEVLNSRDEA